MGEIANDMLNGFLCETCGQIIDGDEPGCTRVCSDCDPKNGAKVLDDLFPINCLDCGRKLHNYEHAYCMDCKDSKGKRSA